MNTTYDLPLNLGDLMGAYDEAHWQTYVGELKPNSGVLTRGSVLSMVAGKLELTKATTEDAAFGILLDLQIDTASPYSDGSVSASVARAGSFRGAALIVAAATDTAKVTDRLRDIGIFTEGVIVAPVAAAMPTESEAPAPAEEPAEP
jgi:hypothetical protein